MSSLFFRKWKGKEKEGTVNCHFCNSTLVLRSNSNSAATSALNEPCAVGIERDFWCGVCGCTNRRDNEGHLLSSDPAHYDEQLNLDSFSKRGHPSLSHLPTLTSPSPFCRTCLSNQSLQLHLLASFPSSPDSDSDDHLLPDYRNSLDSRYPILCSNCANEVESAIRERDYRARSSALGWRLRVSKNGGRGDKGMLKGEEEMGKMGWKVSGVAWKVRGILWWTTQVGSIAGASLAVASPQLFLAIATVTATTHLLIMTLLSFFWSFWDPTWDRARHERARGRKADVVGRATFLRVQGISFGVRLVMAIVLWWGVSEEEILQKSSGALLLFFVLALSLSLSTTYIREPVPIHLTSSRINSRIVLPPPRDPLEPLAELSISPKPSPTGTPSTSRSRKPKSSVPIAGANAKKEVHPTPPQPQPTFGQPSFPSSALPSDENSMDWEPTLPPPRKESPTFVLAPQRFFAPVQPSGLEGLFEERLKFDDDRRGDNKGWREWMKW